MSQMSQVKRAMITAVCIALCVVLPMAFHSIQNAGAIFCPMHIPVLLCGLLVGWPYGLLCGLAGPLLSSLLTGMPAMGYLALHDGGAWRVWPALRSVHEICAHRKNLCGSVHQPCLWSVDRSCDRRSL